MPNTKISPIEEIPDSLETVQLLQGQATQLEQPALDSIQTQPPAENIQTTVPFGINTGTTQSTNPDIETNTNNSIRPPLDEPSSNLILPESSDPTNSPQTASEAATSPTLTDASTPSTIIYGDDDDDQGGGDGGGQGGGGDGDPTPQQLPNGNYAISDGHGFSITLDSISSEAGFQNSFGTYFVDAAGHPISGVVAFANVQDTLGVGDAVTINFAAGDIPTGAVQFGFFIIADGHNQNPALTDGAAVTFAQNGEGEWTPFLNGNELQGAQGAPAYFSDQNLNPDGRDHMQNTEEGQIQVRFEDLLGGGDGDFNDAVINITVEEYSGSQGGDDGGGQGGGDDNGNGNQGNGGNNGDNGNGNQEGNDKDHHNDKDYKDDEKDDKDHRNDKDYKDDEKDDKHHHNELIASFNFCEIK